RWGRTMTRAARTTSKRYGLAILAFVLACAAVNVFPILRGASGTFALTATLVVLAVARWSGTGPALLTTALIALITLPQTMSQELLVRHVLFVVAGVSISLLVGSLREAKQRAEESANQVKGLNADLGRRAAELQTIFEVIPIGVGIAEDASGATIQA